MGNKKILILGAGMTGLAAGYASGYPIYEASDRVGGICASYYMHPGETKRLWHQPIDDEAYRFERGGGHWIFGGDPFVQNFIQTLSPSLVYNRLSAVYFPEQKLFVPYPLQNHLRALAPEIALHALKDMVENTLSPFRGETMEEWLRSSFGETLGRLFFYPFHELYTAGLWRKIAPQDAYKSPVDIALVLEGAFRESREVGYNASFLYPKAGLDHLAQTMAQKSTIVFHKKAIAIDLAQKQIHFEKGGPEPFDILVSTIPLHHLVSLTKVFEREGVSGPCPDPSPGVLVVNLGAKKGKHCPREHWLYIPQSEAGFHRVGFYSNVDSSFLPKRSRTTEDCVSIYVEKAYPQGQTPSEQEQAQIAEKIITELQDWDWIQDVQAMDPTFIETAYTWAWPHSSWKKKALSLLEKHQIYSVGRYGRWVFQGIADSIRDGLMAGASLLR